MLLLAKELGKTIQAGDCFALHGELGAGKSFLARALMRELGVVDEALPSPTFAIIQEYEAARNIKVAHMDWYRLESEHDVHMLGVEDFFTAPWVSLIEWSERAVSLLPKQHTSIHITLDENDMNARYVRINK